MMRIILALLIVFNSVAHADKLPPKQLLEDMCAAMNSKSYRGTFVHLHNNKIESMEVVRRKDSKGDLEKLLSLNGEAREIIRNQDVVTCILPRTEMVTIDKTRPGSQLPLALPQDLSNIEIFYELSLDGKERIAGLDSTIVSLKPKDSYRYGHRIWIADSSKLMLKSDLLDEQGVPIEQIMFTQIALDNKLPDSAFNPSLESAEFKRVDVGKADMQGRANLMLQWRLTQAPQGFALVSHTRQVTKSNQAPVEHMVLSDGMSSVSVFIEPVQGKSLSGASRMGAVNAYGSVNSGHKIIVVGEVPAATVMLINQHVERTGP